jgi:TolA-binding protein
MGRIALLLGVLLARGPAAIAQDRAVLKRSGYSGRIVITGTIDDYTGERLSIRFPQEETVRTYPAAEVVAIKTPQVEAHDRGLKFLQEGRVEDAIRELESALKAEPRAWVRREILALLVQCALRRGDYGSAGSRFLALLKSDSATRHFRIIPLVWSSERIAPAMLGDAKAWMEGTNEAARLIGASLLLDDPAQSLSARTALRELATSADRRIQSLAQFQAWRIESAAGAIGDLQIVRWQERVDELDPDFRTGPSYLLGRAYAARHDYESAAAALLWLPLVDDHDFRLAARACLEAGIALTKIGQQGEAEGLFREVTTRFAETPAAQEAETLLKDLGK